MRDIGVFTSKPLSSHELVEFVRSYSLHVGQPVEKRPDESVVGNPPNVLYVFDATAANHGYFSEEERVAIQSTLGSAPESYVSIHFTTGGFRSCWGYGPGDQSNLAGDRRLQRRGWKARGAAGERIC